MLKKKDTYVEFHPTAGGRRRCDGNNFERKYLKEERSMSNCFG